MLDGKKSFYIEAKSLLCKKNVTNPLLLFSLSMIIFKDSKPSLRSEKRRVQQLVITIQCHQKSFHHSLI